MADIKIDFFARREHFIDHLAPIWQAMPGNYKGIFYIPEILENYFKNKYPKEYYFTVSSTKEGSLSCTLPQSNNPLVICAYGDFQNAYRETPNRLFIMAEHGVGLTPAGENNGGYAGGVGFRRFVDCFLAPNEYIANKTEKVLDTTQYVIGTPKLDRYLHILSMQETLYKIEKTMNWVNPNWIDKRNITICISFHWNGSHVAPEAGNASSIFATPDVLEKLKLKYNLVMHCHPKAREQFKPLAESLDIPFIDYFEDVMDKADIYINDCSSTMYEFLVTGKPVIIMNTPQFRKDVRTGIRFWDYTDIGYQVKNPRELFEAIENTIREPDKHIKQRKKAVEDLYPFLGHSAEKAVEAILHFTQRNKKMEQKLLRTPNYEALTKLLSGHNNSTKGISNIEIEHLAWLGSQVISSDVVVEIGSHRGKSACAMASGILSNPFNGTMGQEMPVINCIDLWQDGNTFEHYKSNETWEVFNKQVKEMGFENIIIPRKMSSEEAFKKYKKHFLEGKAKQLGLLFIDANHHAPFVEQDYRWHEFIVPGGYIALHDYGTRFPAVDHVVDNILKPSGLFEDYAVIGRIFSARRKK